jgi:kynurenine formamidase
MSRLVDLSHAVEAGMVTYPGLPAPEIVDHLGREESRGQYAEGTEFHIGSIRMVGNTGTYVDAPYHRYDGATDLSELPLESLADLPGLVFRHDAAAAPGIEASVFKDQELSGKAVLLETGWSRHWGTEHYLAGNRFLTGAAAQHLRDAGAALVGIDSTNLDDMGDRSRPAHSILLQAQIPVVEHLSNLEELPASGFRFFAVPVKVRRFGTFPVRAFAII